MRNPCVVNDLTIETTRRCNMACEHCLRGPAQDMDMHAEVLDNLFSRISRIRHLTFTGGEPSLRPGIMSHALAMAMKYDVDVGQVYLVTNGKTVTADFMSACMAWHRYTIKCQFGLHGDQIDPDRAAEVIRDACQDADHDRICGCWVSLSLDRFHEPIPRENLLKLACLPHLLLDKYQSPGSTDEWVLNEGFADRNDIGVVDMAAMRPWMFDGTEKNPDASDDGWSTQIEELYVATDGSLLKYCDYSYDDQGDHAYDKISTGVDQEWPERLIRKTLEYEGKD